MRLYIPHLGDALTLAADWTFVLHVEHRNTKFIERTEEDHRLLNLPGTYYRVNYTEARKVYPKPFVIPAGTVLIVDRIYIRKNAPAFDSVTFRVKESPDKRLPKTRFWAKLDDVNTMEI